MKVGDYVRLISDEYAKFDYYSGYNYKVREIFMNGFITITKNDLDCLHVQALDVEKLSDQELQEISGVSIVQRGSPLVPDLGTEEKSSRFNQGKTQVREIDPNFILGIGEVLTASRVKYEEGNWQKETKFSTPYESAQRHLLKFWNGDELDEESKCHHLLHAATNLMFLYYHQTSGKGIDDRLFKKEKK